MGRTTTATPRKGRVGRTGREVVRRIEVRTGVDLRPPLRSVRSRLQRGARPSATAKDIEQLKADVQELRGLGGRVADLTDLVTELLIVAAKREDPEFQRLVAKYQAGV